MTPSHQASPPPPYSHHFNTTPPTKHHIITPHPSPIKPLILLCNAKLHHLLVYDYERRDIVETWHLRDVMREREQQIQCMRWNLEIWSEVMDSSHQNAATAAAFHSWPPAKIDPFASNEIIKAVHWFDESVARLRIGAQNWSQDISKRLAIKTAAQQDPAEPAHANSSTTQYASDLIPISILLQTEKRILMIQYDQLSTFRFRLRELKQSDFVRDGKTKASITCMDVVASHPLIAVGCADGSIRFWNYSTGKVEERMTLRGVHQKAIVKIAVVHQNGGGTMRENSSSSLISEEDASSANRANFNFNSYPTLISLSAEGTLALWNLDKRKPEYTRPKSQDGVAVYDMHVDLTQGTVSVLGYDRSIFVRDLYSGEELRRVKLDASTKVNVSNITCTHYSMHGGISPAWYVLTAAGSSKICQISSTLDSRTWSESLDIRTLDPKHPLPKKAKIYNTVVHPIHSDTIFCGTNFGLFIFKMDRQHSTPAVARVISRWQVAQQNSRNGGGITPSSNSSPTTPTPPRLAERSIFFVKDQAIWRRTASKLGQGKSSPQSAHHFGEASKIFDLLPHDGPVRMHSSHSGRYLSVLWYKRHHLCIYDVTAIENYTSAAAVPQAVFEQENVGDVCWCNFADRFAFLKRKMDYKQMEIYEFSPNTSLIPILENQFGATCGKISHLFGGSLIGVCYEDRNDFHFIEWDGRRNVGDFLPQPTNVKWCGLTNQALLLYKDSYAIFSSYPSLHMQSYVKEKIFDSMWWNGSLFIVTSSEIRCIFVARGQSISSSETIIASFDFGDIGIKSSATAEEEALDPVPQTRPSGTLALVDVVSDRLYVMDVFNRLHSLSLDHPALKFRMLVCANLIERALYWLPYIPVDLHNYLAVFLCERGFSKTAVSELPQLRPSTKFKLCLQYGHHEEAYQTLVQQIDVSLEQQQQNSIVLSPESIGKLYVRLSHLSEQKHDDSMSFQCLERGTELNSPEAFRSLIIHCAKYQKYGRLGELQSQIEEMKGRDSSLLMLVNVMRRGAMG